MVRWKLFIKPTKGSLKSKQSLMHTDTILLTHVVGQESLNYACNIFPVLILDLCPSIWH